MLHLMPRSDQMQTNHVKRWVVGLTESMQRPNKRAQKNIVMSKLVCPCPGRSLKGLRAASLYRTEQFDADSGRTVGRPKLEKKTGENLRFALEAPSSV